MAGEAQKPGDGVDELLVRIEQAEAAALREELAALVRSAEFKAEVRDVLQQPFEATVVSVIKDPEVQKTLRAAILDGLRHEIKQLDLAATLTPTLKPMMEAAIAEAVKSNKVVFNLSHLEAIKKGAADAAAAAAKAAFAQVQTDWTASLERLTKDLQQQVRSSLAEAFADPSTWVPEDLSKELAVVVKSVARDAAAVAAVATVAPGPTGQVVAASPLVAARAADRLGADAATAETLVVPAALASPGPDAPPSRKGITGVVGRWFGALSTEMTVILGVVALVISMLALIGIVNAILTPLSSPGVTTGTPPPDPVAPLQTRVDALALRALRAYQSRVDADAVADWSCAENALRNLSTADFGRIRQGLTKCSHLNVAPPQTESPLIRLAQTEFRDATLRPGCTQPAVTVDGFHGEKTDAAFRTYLTCREWDVIRAPTLADYVALGVVLSAPKE